jgi:hypothetical protein
MRLVKIASLIGDLMCLGGELLTGKSIPILIGIVSLPIDRWLACVVVSMGAVAGALFSVYTSRATHGLTLTGSINRLTQQSFSLFLSLSLLLSISRGIHYDRGMVLSLVPSFCITLFSLPPSKVPGIISFLLSCVLLAVCTNTRIRASDVDAFASTPRTLQAQSSTSLKEESAGLWQIVLRALQLFALALYASLQHAPTQVYFKAATGNGPRHLLHVHHHIHHHNHHHGSEGFASHHHSMDTHYAILVGLASALLRVTFWYILCFFQDNTMHVMLENDHTRGGWDWACCALYITTLLYAASWTATQLVEQVLPHLGLTSHVDRVRLVAAVLSLAALYRQRDADALFLSTNIMLVLSVGATVLTLK